MKDERGIYATLGWRLETRENAITITIMITSDEHDCNPQSK